LVRALLLEIYDAGALPVTTCFYAAANLVTQRASLWDSLQDHSGGGAVRCDEHHVAQSHKPLKHRTLQEGVIHPVQLGIIRTLGENPPSHPNPLGGHDISGAADVQVPLDGDDSEYED
jgi:hypothetical protein